jgi:hypothetical protein
VDTRSDMNLNGGNAAGGKGVHHETGWSRYNRRRHRIYLGILVFVVVAGLPMIGIPSLRYRLRTRVQGLRAAYAGAPVVQAPAFAKVGESREPFPRAYERQQPLPAYLPKIELPAARPPLGIILGGGDTPSSIGAGEPQSASRRPPRASSAGGQAAAPAGKSEPKLVLPGFATATSEPPAADAGSEPQFRKGKSEQEAYDLLFNANQTLAGLVKGSDPTLKFQDWSAATMGENSLYVMVTFVQTADNIVRKYIWNVKVATKEVIPLSAYAMSISK